MMTNQGQVITFYSFKGGVGRSMALANIAAIYAQRGKRVLALDFDFEAPGLHRYFLSPREEGETLRHEPTEPRHGVLNYFAAVQDELQRQFPEGIGFDTPEAQKRLPGLLGELLDAGDYLYTVRVEDPNQKRTAPVPIHFIPAARFDNTYPELVRSFDWQLFYDAYAEVFPALTRELSRRYDYVLIDSRTGVTDIGSICTMLLPDKLVLVFTPNEQSLRGALDAGWQAVEGRKAMHDRPPLQVFPLLSRVEDGEEQLKQKWIARARQGFKRLYCEAYGGTAPDLATFFNAVRVPHRGYYAYGERIAAEEQVAAEIGSLSHAYHKLADCLNCEDISKALGIILGSGFDPNAELVQSLLGQLQNRLPRQPAKLTPYEPLLRIIEAGTDILHGHTDQGLQGLDGLIQQFKQGTSARSKQALATVVELKAQALSALDRQTEALTEYEDLLNHIGGEADPSLRVSAGSAQLNIGVILQAQQAHEQALAAIEKALLLLDGDDTARTQEPTARALNAKAEALEKLQRHEEALATLDQLIERFGDSMDPRIASQINSAKNHRARLTRQI